MIKKENLDKTNAWPFVEAKKMLRERKSLIEKKGKITLQTGYGPSGLPHIGTFGEVARTSMMVNALKQLTDLLQKSDDLNARLSSICAVLHHKIPDFFWTGFYLLSKDNKLFYVQIKEDKRRNQKYFMSAFWAKKDK